MASDPIEARPRDEATAVVHVRLKVVPGASSDAVGSSGTTDSATRKWKRLFTEATLRATVADEYSRSFRAIT